MATQRKNLKRCMSGISGRRKRKETIVSIRKAKKEDGNAIRRNMVVTQNVNRREGESILKDIGRKSQSLLVGLQNPDTRPRALDGLQILMTSGVPPLFDEKDEEYAEIWNTIMNAIPILVQSLGLQGDIKSQSNAAFSLRFIASMDRARHVVAAQALPPLVTLLHSCITDLQVHAAWCLGNIAAESPQLCREVLQYCTIPQILSHIRMSTPVLRRAAVWLLRNLCDYQYETTTPSSSSSTNTTTVSTANPSTISDEIVQVLVQIIGQLTKGVEKTVEQEDGIAPWRVFQIQTGKAAPNDTAIVRFLCMMGEDTCQVVDADVCFDTGENEVYTVKVDVLKPLECLDEEIDDDADEVLDEVALTICDCFWTLVGITLPDVPVLHPRVEAIICTLIVDVLKTYRSSVMISPVLRVLGNIVSGTDDHSKVIIDGNFLSVVPNLLYCRQREVREEVCWVLSNIAGGSPEQVEAILSHSNILIRLAELLKWAEWDVRREASWAVCNIIIRSTGERLPAILGLDILSSFNELLEERDPQITLLILEALDSILDKGKCQEVPGKVNPYAIAVEESECLCKIESLCYDENQEICEASAHILDQYFSASEGEHSNDLTPTLDSTQNMFVFKPPETTTEFKFD